MQREQVPLLQHILLRIGLCLFALALAGCQGRTYPPGSPLDPNYRPPPSNASQAAALSGGKITQFVPTVDANPANPVDKEMLEACRQIKLSGHTAHGAYNVIVCPTGKTLFKVLVVGQDELMSPSEAIRELELETGGLKKGYGYYLKGHDVTMARDGAMLIFPNSRQFPQQYIVLTPGSPFADVGGAKISLQQPVVWVEPEKVQVMLLSDWLKLFQASDAQTGGHSIRQVGLIYKLPPYGHF